MPMMKETMLKRLLLPIAAAGGGGSAPVQDTATGNPLVFFTDLARPLKSLLIPFSPQQEGSGDPSPQNIRSILPWDGLTVWNGSGNLCGADIEQGEYNYTYGNKQDSETRIRSDYIPISAGTYTISCTGMQNVVVYVFDKNKSVIIEESTRIWKNMPYSFTISGDRYIAFVWRKTSDPQITPSDISDVMLSVGSNAQPYVPYAPITDTNIVFPSPVYGGTLDVVSGVLTVEWGIVNVTSDDIDGFSEKRAYTKVISGAKSFSYTEFARNMFCDKIAQEPSSTWYPPAFVGFMNNAARFVFGAPDEVTNTAQAKALVEEMGGMVLAYQLAEPQTVTLTPAQITALVGDNTIWSDADGKMTATYLKKA